MSEWRRVKLSECCQSIADGDHQPPPKAETGIPFVTISNMTSTNQFDFGDTLFVPQQYYDSLDDKRKAKKNDILYSVVGSFGIPVFMKEDKEFVFQRHIAILRPNEEEIVPRFLFYTMLTRDFYAKADAAAIGAAQRTVSLTALRNMEIDIPAKELQCRIVDILSAYDDLIDNNQKQIMLLEEATQRLYKEWFVELRFPGYESVRMVDGVPEEWEMVSLDDVIQKITTGLNPRKNFVLGKGNNYYVTIKNMGENNIYLDDKCDKIDDEALEKINRRSDLRTGDILFSGIGTMGRVYLISIPTNNWNVSESVFTIRANDRITNEYLYLVLLSDDMKSYCDQNAHGAAQRGIRMADLRAYKFLLPPQGILNEFTMFANPLIKKVQSLQHQKKDLTEARDRLLPKLMSGEIEL